MLDFIKEELSSLIIKDITYLNTYLEFVQQNITDDGKTESHHILPRAIFPQHIRSDWNIVRMSPRNHFLAHYYLFKAISHSKVAFAFNMMKRIIKNQSEEDIIKLSLLFEEAREDISRLISEANTGKLRSKEFKQAVSKRFTNTICVVDSAGNRFRVSNKIPHNHKHFRIGFEHKESTKQKIGNASRGTRAVIIDNKVRLLKGTDIPKDAVFGQTQKFKDTMSTTHKGRISYFDDQGNNFKLRPEDPVPNGLQRGRTNFGSNGNKLTQRRYYINALTGEKLALAINEPPKPYFVNTNCKGLYKFNNQVSFKKPRYWDDYISLDNRDTILIWIQTFELVTNIIQPRRKPGPKSCVD